MYGKLADLIQKCQKDKNVKVILLHGGKNFSVGNDISEFAKVKDMKAAMGKLSYGMKVLCVNMCLAVASSVKPVVVVVRGWQVGIACTMASHATFLYCSPDAKFRTPFMASSQSPEGTSTLTFPQLLGPRKANEMLLLDATLGAQDAVKQGFANDIVDQFDPASEWFNPDVIPAIPKLLATDYHVLVNGMEQLNHSKDLKRIEEVTRREADAVVK